MATHLTLNTGARIPSVGLGTYKAGPGIVGDTVAAAVKAGYRHIDCASLYKNEKEIGVALKKLFVNGVVKREDLFITSKLWCSDLAPEDVPLAIDSTLKDPQLDYVDLYLIHWPFQLKKGSEIRPENFVQPDIPKTWRAMEQQYDSGKARAIGVSNFSMEWPVFLRLLIRSNAILAGSRPNLKRSATLTEFIFQRTRLWLG